MNRRCCWAAPIIVTLLLAACGGRTSSEEPCSAKPQDGGKPISFDGVSVTLAAVAAVTDDSDPTFIALIFSESPTVCDQWLTSKGFEDAADVFVVVTELPTEATLPLVRPIAENRPTAAVVQRGCGGTTTEQHATGGALTITMYKPGKQVAGSVDAILASGHHVMLAFDTCFCTASTKCSTAL